MSPSIQQSQRILRATRPLHDIDVFLSRYPFVAAKVVPDNPTGTRNIQDRITIATTPEQDIQIQSFLDRAAKDPGVYALFGRNCARFVEQALSAGGLSSSNALTPRGLISDLHRLYDGKGMPFVPIGDHLFVPVMPIS
jgi:hypothetical protein